MGCFALASAVKGRLHSALFQPYGYALLMRPDKTETAVRGCHCLGDMAVRLRKVLARRWVGHSSSVPLWLPAKSLLFFTGCTRDVKVNESDLFNLAQILRLFQHYCALFIHDWIYENGVNNLRHISL